MAEEPPRKLAENNEESARRKPKAKPARFGKKKPRGRGFAPGVSGNPGGRPKSSKETQELAAQYTEEAVLTLVSIMRTVNDPKEVRQAAIAIINRACGMPSQPLTGAEGTALIPTRDDALTALQAYLDRGKPPVDSVEPSGEPPTEG